jgi:hypothetical protein
MASLINPEDWFLILTVLASLATFPLVIAMIAMACKIPLSKIFNKAIWTVVAQLFGIVIFTLLLIQININSDGLGAKLLYGRF